MTAFYPAQLAELLPAGARIWLQECSAAAPVLHELLREVALRRDDMRITGIFVPGLNDVSDLARAGVAVETFFAAPTLAGLANVSFLPLNYAAIRARLRSIRIDAAVFAVAPPDAAGRCSFGPVCDFLPDLWPHIPVRIGLINPLLPRTEGASAIPLREMTAVLEAASALPESPSRDTPLGAAVGRHVAALVPDGAVVQCGLGGLPEAALLSLRGHRELALWSGLIGDACLNLLEAGALRSALPITAGVAIGTRRLYGTLSDPAFRFAPVSRTHDLTMLSELPGLVTLNSANQVDLFGQAYAESRDGRPASGPGGATDFAAGARLANGLRVVLLAATGSGGAASRIVPAGQGEGPVSLSRFDVDVVVTEHGAADLRGITLEERAERLIAIAAPAHQAALEASRSDRRGG